jgi:hypothetical protein
MMMVLGVHLGVLVRRIAGTFTASALGVGVVHELVKDDNIDLHVLSRAKVCEQLLTMMWRRGVVDKLPSIRVLSRRSFPLVVCGTRVGVTQTIIF